jgi:ribosomal protein S18 acetylase RimI-like enzyme
MNLRPAKTEDLALLFAIHRSVFRSHIEKLWGWDEDWQCENFLSECTTVATTVIEVDEQIAGYIQVLDRERQIYVQNIAIGPAFQNTGIGTMLLKDLQSRATARKVPIHLGVFRTNTPAQRLYKRLGFCNVGETRTHIELSWIAPHLASDSGKP